MQTIAVATVFFNAKGYTLFSFQEAIYYNHVIVSKYLYPTF